MTPPLSFMRGSSTLQYLRPHCLKKWCNNLMDQMQQEFSGSRSRTSFSTISLQNWGRQATLFLSTVHGRTKLSKQLLTRLRFRLQEQDKIRILLSSRTRHVLQTRMTEVVPLMEMNSPRQRNALGLRGLITWRRCRIGQIDPNTLSKRRRTTMMNSQIRQSC